MLRGVGATSERCWRLAFAEKEPEPGPLLPAGITLRDWFAGQALAGMAGVFLDFYVRVSDERTTASKAFDRMAEDCAEREGAEAELIALLCQQLADAMLAQREKPHA